MQHCTVLYCMKKQKTVIGVYITMLIKSFLNFKDIALHLKSISKQGNLKVLYLLFSK